MRKKRGGGLLTIQIGTCESLRRERENEREKRLLFMSKYTTELSILPCHFSHHVHKTRSTADGYLPIKYYLHSNMAKYEGRVYYCNKNLKEFKYVSLRCAGLTGPHFLSYTAKGNFPNHCLCD